MVLLVTDHWTIAFLICERRPSWQISHDSRFPSGDSVDTIVLTDISGLAFQTRYAAASAHARVRLFWLSKLQAEVGACGRGGGNKMRFSASTRPRCKKNRRLRYVAPKRSAKLSLTESTEKERRCDDVGTARSYMSCVAAKV